MTIKNKSAFWALAVLGICLAIVFLSVPANKYEWMLDAPESQKLSAQLPEDAEARMRLFIYAVPMLLVAIAAIANGFINCAGRWRKAAVGFGVALLLIALFRVASTI